MVPSASPASQSPSGKHYSKKQIVTSDRQTGSYSQFTTTKIHHNEAPECFVHDQSFSSSRYTEKYLFHQTRFYYDKSPKEGLLQNSFLKHSYNERKESFCKMNMSQRTLERYFVFTIALY